MDEEKMKLSPAEIAKSVKELVGCEGVILGLAYEGSVKDFMSIMIGIADLSPDDALSLAEGITKLVTERRDSSKIVL